MSVVFISFFMHYNDFSNFGHLFGILSCNRHLFSRIQTLSSKSSPICSILLVVRFSGFFLFFIGFSAITGSSLSLLSISSDPTFLDLRSVILTVLGPRTVKKIIKGLDNSYDSFLIADQDYTIQLAFLLYYSCPTVQIYLFLDYQHLLFELFLH